MSQQKKYLQITETINPKIIGRGELPLTVEIKDKNFIEQSGEYMMNFNKYFDEKEKFFERFPKNLIGKMYQKKKDPIDLMAVMPYHPIISFIISEKVKSIFEKLKIEKSEYHLEELSIEGSNEKFYFLFIPVLKSSDYLNFSKSEFYDGLKEKFVIFGSYYNYEVEKRNANYRAKVLYVSKELANRDVINMQTGRPFFSERIIEAFSKENVIGFDIITQGDSKIELNFNE